MRLAGDLRYLRFLLDTYGPQATIGEVWRKERARLEGK